MGSRVRVPPRSPKNILSGPETSATERTQDIGDNLMPNGLSQALFEFSKILQNRLCLQYVCKRVVASLVRPQGFDHAIPGPVFPAAAGQLRNAIPVGATGCRSARSRSDPVPKRSTRMHRARQGLHGWVD